jgi:hypothetical protein
MARPGGTVDNSPAIHGWESSGYQSLSPGGTAEIFNRPSGTR